MAFFTQLKTCTLTVIITSLMMSGCQSASDSAEIMQSKSLQIIPDTLFSESHSVMPIEPRSRRKWDNPLIADLDKDGLLEVIITDHAHAANIMWNNGDKFSAPQLLIGGDTPTEAFSAVAAGATGIKLFPITMVGMDGFKALKSVLSADTKCYPVGGIEPNEESMHPYLKARATGFGLGSAIYKPNMSHDEIRNRARSFIKVYNDFL